MMPYSTRSVRQVSATQQTRPHRAARRTRATGSRSRLWRSTSAKCHLSVHSVCPARSPLPPPPLHLLPSHPSLPPSLSVKHVNAVCTGVAACSLPHTNASACMLTYTQSIRSRSACTVEVHLLCSMTEHTNFNMFTIPEL